MAFDEADIEILNKLLTTKMGDLKDSVFQHVSAELGKRDDQFKGFQQKLETFSQSATPGQNPAQGQGQNPAQGQGQGQGQNQGQNQGEGVAAAGTFEAQVKSLEERLKRTQAQAEEAVKERERLLEEAKEQKLHSTIEQELLKKYPAEQVPNIMARLTVDGRLKYDDQGRPCIHFQRNGYEELLNGAKAVAEFSQSDLGKVFLPPSNAQGTGESRMGRVGTAPMTSGGDPDWDAAAEGSPDGQRNILRIG